MCCRKDYSERLLMWSLNSGVWTVKRSRQQGTDIIAVSLCWSCGRAVWGASRNIGKTFSWRVWFVLNEDFCPLHSVLRKVFLKYSHLHSFFCKFSLTDGIACQNLQNSPSETHLLINTTVGFSSFSALCEMFSCVCCADTENIDPILIPPHPENARG